MSKTVIIVAVVAVVAVVAFMLLNKKKPGGSVVAASPPVSVPKQTNLVSQIVSSAPSLISSLSGAYATYEEYKD